MFSQKDEEAYILKHVGGMTGGKVLDIGSADGLTMSNSRELILRGWHGVLVEPSPDQFMKLMDMYGQAERIQLVNAAVGLAWGLSPFWHSSHYVSTTVAEHHEKWSSDGAYDCAYWVPMVPITEILNRFGPFDVVSIDVEGASAELLSPVLTCHPGKQPRVIVIEHDEQVPHLTALAEIWGYHQVAVNPENLVLVR